MEDSYTLEKITECLKMIVKGQRGKGVYEIRLLKNVQFEQESRELIELVEKNRIGLYIPYNYCKYCFFPY